MHECLEHNERFAIRNIKLVSSKRDVMTAYNGVLERFSRNHNRIIR